VLVVVGVVALPAIALRAACVGKSCTQAEQQPAPAPFCSLDAGTRALVTAGFYAGRSPDAIAVTAAPGTVVTSVGGGLDVPWPSVAASPMSPQIPFVLLGTTVRSVPGSSSVITLDQVAPTVAELMKIKRPHPHVRSGTPIDAVRALGPAVPLAVEIVWKGVGMLELQTHRAKAPYLSGLLVTTQRANAVSLPATPGSAPFDPTAVLTTIGSGGLPFQHGVTGTVFMSEHGPVHAFSDRAPEPVIAALGDDLPHVTNGKAQTALVGDAPTDRGLVGGTWWDHGDTATVEIAGDTVSEVRALLRSGYGTDEIPDLIGVTLSGSLSAMDTTTKSLVAEVQRAVPRTVFVMTSTGSAVSEPGSVDARTDLAKAVNAAIPAPGPVVAGVGSGGLFLDPETTTAAGITTQSVVDVLKGQTGADGTPLFADAFPSFAVQFGRYCT
jgi:hypothetical protein